MTNEPDYCDVYDYLGVPPEDIPKLVATLSDKERKELLEEVEEILLLTPQGTGSEELEKTLNDLYLFFCPED